MKTYQDVLNNPEKFEKKLISNLKKIDDNIPEAISFNVKIQKDNIISLINDAHSVINRYEQIYPYVKSMCKDQTIDPLWFTYIENILEWALSMGRGNRGELSEDIKTAWLTYIVLLSLSMIDKTEDIVELAAPNRLKISGAQNLINLTESN